MSDHNMSESSQHQDRMQQYWKKNISIIGALLAVWAVVSYGFGILLVEPMNNILMPGSGLPLGFWFAQQGAIYVFVVLIYIYAKALDKLDKEFDVNE